MNGLHAWIGYQGIWRGLGLYFENEILVCENLVQDGVDHVRPGQIVLPLDGVYLHQRVSVNLNQGLNFRALLFSFYLHTLMMPYLGIYGNAY
jgi:hypothetical protein